MYYKQLPQRYREQLQASRPTVCREIQEQRALVQYTEGEKRVRLVFANYTPSEAAEAELDRQIDLGWQNPCVVLDLAPVTISEETMNYSQMRQEMAEDKKEFSRSTMMELVEAFMVQFTRVPKACYLSEALFDQWHEFVHGKGGGSTETLAISFGDLQIPCYKACCTLVLV